LARVQVDTLLDRPFFVAAHKVVEDMFFIKQRIKVEIEIIGTEAIKEINIHQNGLMDIGVDEIGHIHLNKLIRWYFTLKKPSPCLRLLEAISRLPCCKPLLQIL
jgi:hypothetical protein